VVSGRDARCDFDLFRRAVCVLALHGTAIAYLPIRLTLSGCQYMSVLAGHLTMAFKLSGLFCLMASIYKLDHNHSRV
jgi:hypothetical protein